MNIKLTILTVAGDMSTLAAERKKEEWENFVGWLCGGLRLALAASGLETGLATSDAHHFTE